MYGKIFTNIYESTLMSQHGWLGVYVFSSMCVLADKDGILDIDDKQLYKRIGLDEPLGVNHGNDHDIGYISFETFKSVLTELCHPDPNSNIKKLDGKRLVRLSDFDDIPTNRGYFIVNYEEYRNRGSKEERNEYTRGYVAAMRKIDKDPSVVNKYNKNSGVRGRKKVLKNVVGGKKTKEIVINVMHTDTDTNTDINTNKNINEDLFKQGDCQIDSGESLPMREIFDLYCQSWNKTPQYKFTPQRKGWIKKALSVYGKDGCMVAIKAFREDSFAERVRFNDLKYLFGTQDRIDKWCSNPVTIKDTVFNKEKNKHDEKKAKIALAIEMSNHRERKNNEQKNPIN